MRRALHLVVVRLYLIAYWVRTILYLVTILGLWAAIVHGVMEARRHLRRRARYSAARIAAATSAASVSPA